MAYCSVLRCNPEIETSIHNLPKDPALKHKWLCFIYQHRGSVPDGIEGIPVHRLVVCSKHFTDDCFKNRVQKSMGFAKRLILKHDAVPTVHPGTGTTAVHPGTGTTAVHPGTGTTAVHPGTGTTTVHPGTTAASGSRHVPPEPGTVTGCQAYLTVPRRSVATQLSKGTLVSIRSHGCQTGPPFRTRSIGVGTDNQGLKRSRSGKALQFPPAKRPWVAIAFTDVGLVNGPKKADSSTSEKSSIQIDACRDQQPTCLPSLHVSEKRSSSGVVHPEHVSFSEHMDLSVLEDVCVNLGCLLQLFQRCERCRGVCAVSTRGDGEHFSVLGRCKDCSQQTTWSNQPVGVSDELVNPPDQGKGHVETPEGTGITKRQGKANTKTDKLFVELEVTIDSDAEQSADENVFGGLEEEGEEEEEEEEEMEGVSDSDVEDGQQEQEEKGNGGIENTENGQFLAIRLSEWDDWQTEDVKDEQLKEEEEEEQEEEPIDEKDEDWEEEEDDDEEEVSDSEKKSNIKQSRKPRPKSTNKRRVRRTPLLCPDCGVTYTAFKHVCHDPGEFVICSECGARCASEVSLKVHRMDCKGRTHACKYCQKQLATWEDKLDHEEQSLCRTEKDPYLCSECPQRFSTIKERRFHFKEHKKIFCPTCHKQFTKSHNLRRHMLSHSSDKPFRCKVCSRAFAQASQLKCHTRVHTGERPYKCQLCPLQFNHNISLKNHVQRHHHQKEHQDDPDADSLVTTSLANLINV